MPYCSQCGNDVTGRDFCPRCGAENADADAANPYAVGSQTQGVMPVAAGDAPEIPGFFGALRVCFLKKHARFRGRASRAEFWFFALWIALFWLGVSVVVANSAYLTIPIVIISALFLSLFMILPSFSVGVRRFHDIGRPGWLFFALASPLFLSFDSATVGAGLFIPHFSGGMNAFPVDVANFLISAVYVAPLVVLIVLLCLPGEKGPNKYGLAPVKRR